MQRRGLQAGLKLQFESRLTYLLTYLQLVPQLSSEKSRGSFPPYFDQWTRQSVRVAIDTVRIRSLFLRDDFHRQHCFILAAICTPALPFFPDIRTSEISRFLRQLGGVLLRLVRSRRTTARRLWGRVMMVIAYNTTIIARVASCRSLRES